MIIKSNKGRKRKIVFFALLFMICLGVLQLLRGCSDDREPIWDDNLSQSSISEITYDGKQYRYNHNLINILYLGIDNNDVIRNDMMPGNAGQTDCIMILSLNKETKQAKIVIGYIRVLKN